MDDPMDIDANEAETKRNQTSRPKSKRLQEKQLKEATEQENVFIEYGTAHLGRKVPAGELSKVKEEWNSLSNDDAKAHMVRELNNLLDLQRLLDESQANEKTYKARLRSLSATSTRRPKYMDLYDTSLHDIIKACDNFLKALQELEDWCGNDPGSVFLESLRWRRDEWRDKRSTLHDEMIAFQRDHLYPFKRNAPGRKVDAPQIPQEDFNLLRDRQKKMASIIPALPPSIFPIGDIYAVDWTCVNKVGDKGGQNLSVDILLGVDVSNRIVERKVRKNISMQRNWKTPQWWHGDFEGDGPLYPREYFAQRLMSRRDAKFVVKALGKPRYDEANKVVQMYMEYALHSDLDEAMRTHGRSNTPVPKPFLWMLFQTLVEPAYIMKHGSLPGGKQPRDWLEMVHHDIKPANVFLDSSDLGHFPMYPRPKLADYGLCLLTNANDERNPRIYTGAGTPGYKAPEMLRFIDSKNGKRVDDHDKILSPCNVWGIGATLYALMTLRPLDNEPPPEYQLPYCVTDKAPDVGPFEHDVAGDVAARWGPGMYGTDLIEAVQGCLRFHPEDRWKIEELRENVESVIVGDATYRKMNTGRPVGQMPALLYKPEVGGYRDGLTCPPEWVPPPDDGP